MCTKEQIQEAKQYLSEQGYGTGTNITLNAVANLMAEWFAKKCIIPDVSSSLKVGTYSLSKEGDSSYCHWSEGLKMVIEKDGVVIKLEGEEIEKLVGSLPRTFGGTY